MNKIIQHIVLQTNLSEQEAWWMLETITNKKKTELLLTDTTLSSQEQAQLQSWITQLTLEHMPLSYLLGSVPFLDITIKVQPPILIPRPETEEWVSELITMLQPHHNNLKTILDIGTGSGCIAISLAKAFPKASITATDINDKALQLAQENAKLNGITNINFITSDLFQNLHNKQFDLIVSNPPYIDPKHTLMPQVANWEDKKALFAQDSGLKIIKQIIVQAPNFLTKQPELPYQLIIEHDHDQQDIIKQFANKYDFDCEHKKDLFGNYRTSWLQFKNFKNK